jgi:predicted CoA-binding protein
MWGKKRAKSLSIHSKQSSLLIMSTTAAATSSSSFPLAMFQLKRWAVIGDILNPQKAAAQVADRLKQLKYSVQLINPRATEEQQKQFNVSKSLTADTDVIDLCINNHDGLNYIKSAKELGISRIFIQPGAESKEILDYCKENNIATYQGCVLRELHEPLHSQL